jgi:hypothetical protein
LAILDGPIYQVPDQSSFYREWPGASTMRDKMIEGEASDRKRANQVLRHGRPILSRGVDLTRIFFCVCRPWHRNRSGARPSSRSSKMATEYGRKSEECPTLARSVACAERQARADGLIEVEAGVRPGPGAAVRSMPARTPRRSKTTHMLKTTQIYCVMSRGGCGSRRTRRPRGCAGRGDGTPSACRDARRPC